MVQLTIPLPLVQRRLLRLHTDGPTERLVAIAPTIAPPATLVSTGWTCAAWERQHPL